MKKTAEFSQFEGEEGACLQTETSLLQREERVLRRAVLEILPFLFPWAEKKTLLTQKTLQETLKRPSLYENAPAEQWRGILEDFTEKNLEVLFPKKSLQLSEILNFSQKKTPLKDRLQELEENKNDTLVYIWSKETGLLAATTTPLPKHFPLIKTEMLTHIPPTVQIWTWDRKNFQNS